MKLGEKTKITIVNVGNNPLAKEVAQALRESGYKNVTVLPMQGEYAGWYGLATTEPEYTIILKEGNACKVQPCRVQGYTGKRLGDFVARDLAESQRAKAHYRHQLKMLGLDPQLLGTYTITWDEVRYDETAWYWLDKSPLLWAELPNELGVARAVCRAISGYIDSKYQ